MRYLDRFGRLTSSWSTCHSCEGSDEALVEAEEVFDAVAVSGEWRGAVKLVDGFVEVLRSL